ncbi:MAG: permease for cytosine/purines uracil thiamine allantoin [Acidimicrobiaceae bacterium]|nr:permease for cytosine/purines uracil thiamine allantoin [Acidimicrobiaceae bacterium]
MSDDVAERLENASVSPLRIEENGIDVIAENERRGRPRELFWPWFGANVSVLGLSYGSFVLGFGISFVQAVIVGLIGIVFSFWLCGIIATAGNRGSAPTMVLSRAAFGVRGNRLPSAISWLLCVGWETALTVIAVLATSTVFTRIGWSGGSITKVAAMIVVAGLIILGGVMGFDLIMRMQAIITVVTAVLTVVFVALTVKHISGHAVTHVSGGSFQSTIGALVFVMTGFGLGWVNVAADYSRYLPRGTSSRAVVWWTTFGASIAPIILLFFGLLLAGSSASLSSAVGDNPVGALAKILPTWFLVPFVIVAILGLVGGAVLDIYSSGLALLSAGLKIPRYAAAGVDGVIMLLGTVYLVFIKRNFLGQFEGFLITIGVLIAAWCGVFLGDLVLRRKSYVDEDLFRPAGRYGDVRVAPLTIIVLSSALGLGLVTNTAASWLIWQGYLLGPIGLGGKRGAWAYANLGVLVALALSFVLTVLFTRTDVAREESLS